MKVSVEIGALNIQKLTLQELETGQGFIYDKKLYIKTAPTRYSSLNVPQNYTAAIQLSDWTMTLFHANHSEFTVVDGLRIVNK